MKTNFMFLPSAVRASFSLALALSIVGATSTGFSGSQDAIGVTDATDIAAEFRDNPKTADAAWRDKPVVVTGTVQRLISGDNTTKVAQVALKTGEGMPVVKVDFAPVSDQSAAYEFRINNGRTLEVRTKQKNMFPNTFPTALRGHATKQPAAAWKVLLNVGEQATFVGQCRGRVVDVIVANGALVKQGWNGGGAAMLAGGGGGANAAGDAFDPSAAFRRTQAQQQFQNQQVQQNMQINQQNAAQGVQNMLMNQRR